MLEAVEGELAVQHDDVALGVLLEHLKLFGYGGNRPGELGVEVVDAAVDELVGSLVGDLLSLELAIEFRK